MATLSAKKIQDAIKKAQNIGRVEEPVTVCGCNVVLQSLRPDEYSTVLADIEEIPEGIGYLNAYKREHLARSICEFNDTDIRDFDFVEVDVEEIDPKTQQPVVKTVKLERHVFVRDYVIASWGREAIDVAFRKFNDVIALAEKNAAEGVKFVVPEETQEDKYRRLLQEAKEIEGHVPIELSSKIREDLGYMTKTTEAEFSAAEAALSRVEQKAEAAQEAPQEAAPAPQEPPPQPTPKPVQATPRARTAPQPAQPPPQVKPLPQEAEPSPEELMRARKPLNMQAAEVPTPPPAMQANPVIPVSSQIAAKSAKIAALEGADQFDPNPPPAIQGGTQLAAGEAVPGHIVAASPGMERTPMELSKPFQKVDPTKAEAIFEQPPVAGINPRFRKPPTF